MKNFKRICLAITKNKVFEIVIIAVIILNSILIGVETYNNSEIVRLIQQINLSVFTIEIILRFIAAGSISNYQSVREKKTPIELFNTILQ